MMLAALALAAVTAADAGAAPATVNGCTEIVPQGSVRPDVTDTLPTRGRSGYAATLVVTVKHGKGESVLPSGLSLQSHSEDPVEGRREVDAPAQPPRPARTVTAGLRLRNRAHRTDRGRGG